jgi:hypothetical protein
MAKKTNTRVRRTAEQLIADLEAKIQSIKTRAERAKVKRDPALRHVNAALRSVDKALSVSEDVATREALNEARVTLSACLTLHGVAAPAATGARRRRGGGAAVVDENTVLAHVQQHPGQGGAEIAAALGTDVGTLRPTMKRLIEARRVRATGKARGTRYAAV